MLTYSNKYIFSVASLFLAFFVAFLFSFYSVDNQVYGQDNGINICELQGWAWGAVKLEYDDPGGPGPGPGELSPPQNLTCNAYYYYDPITGGVSHQIHLDWDKPAEIPAQGMDFYVVLRDPGPAEVVCDWGECPPSLAEYILTFLELEKNPTYYDERSWYIDAQGLQVGTPYIYSVIAVTYLDEPPSNGVYDLSKFILSDFSNEVVCTPVGPTGTKCENNQCVLSDNPYDSCNPETCGIQQGSACIDNQCVPTGDPSDTCDASTCGIQSGSACIDNQCVPTGNLLDTCDASTCGVQLGHTRCFMESCIWVGWGNPSQNQCNSDFECGPSNGNGNGWNGNGNGNSNGNGGWNGNGGGPVNGNGNGSGCGINITCTGECGDDPWCLEKIGTLGPGDVVTENNYMCINPVIDIWCDDK